MKLEQKYKPHCPVCNHKLDAYTSTDDEETHPKEGDVSICIKCVSILLFKETEKGMNLCVPSTKEQKELEKNYELKEIVETIKLAKLSTRGFN